MKIRKVKMSITIDEDVEKLIQRDAEKDDRKSSQMINKILRDYYRQKGELN